MKSKTKWTLVAVFWVLWLGWMAWIVVFAPNSDSNSVQMDSTTTTTTVIVQVDDPPQPLFEIQEPIDLPVTTALRVAPPTTNPCDLAGLNCLPFAPTGLDSCQEMVFYMNQWSLPVRFDDSGRHQRWTRSDGYGWRESKCDNTAISPNNCCGGYWQLYIGSFMTHGHADELSYCDVDLIDDVVGPEPYDKQRQACVTAWLYFLSGEGDSPWSGT